MEDIVVFNLCEDLKAKEGVSERDQCPPGTRCCLTKVNKKDGEPDRTVAVLPVVQTASLNLSSSIITSPKGLSLVFYGASYPPSGSGTPQSLNMTLLCTAEGSGPQLKSYNGTEIQVEWNTPSACGTMENDDGKNDEKGDDSRGDGSKQSVGSGVGWFFLVLILAFATYFGLGAYYNYATYGASGVDLIPHRDFWKEVPYMLSDVVSHLCSSVRSRRTSSRGGYISV
ncbi:hypothetical protein E1B28_000508 [Marasmius oreades]|uniref:Autophagy-related protein 27 n=1 Tax=Marasmius oreades TaxID=181124 RepID=A0A9P8AEF1_9AGAR|nr:uncharacterized protein E1B28_000508 [Marasmius oreades]KAG7098577.1 hypothetical protein E1B28_000508 [Marasmius oreades]